jgi:hypothetical protein
MLYNSTVKSTKCTQAGVTTVHYRGKTQEVLEHITSVFTAVLLDRPRRYTQTEIRIR